MKHFLINLDLCNGCYCCQIACKDEHVGNDWAPYAKPQPDTGQFWIKLNEKVRGTTPKVKVSYLPSMCMHCKDADCMKSCQVPGAIYRRKDGLINIDPEKCTGCRSCVDACRYEAIYFNENLNIAQKCTGCSHLLDDAWVEPRCVDACPTDALIFKEESEIADSISLSEPVNGEKTNTTLVHYLNIPKRFIAGTVYSPEEKEVIIGATCTLQSTSTETTITTETDDFGDFWFHSINTDEVYSLIIEKNEKTVTINEISSSSDVNLGDIPMT